MIRALGPLSLAIILFAALLVGCDQEPDEAEPSPSAAGQAEASPSATSQPAPNPSAAAQAVANQRLAFVSNRDGAYRMYTMNPDGGDIRKVSEQVVSPWPFSVSQDGTQVVVWEDHDPVSGSPSSRVHRVDVSGGGTEFVAEPPLVDEGPLIMAPRWQTDDSAVLVNAGAGGACYAVPTGGGEVREESPDKCLEALIVAESPQGSLAALTGASLVVVEAPNATPRVLDRVMAPKSEGEEGAGWDELTLGALLSVGVMRPVWSPDGKWIAYLDFDANDGQSGVSVISAEGGEPHLLVPVAEDSSDILFPTAWSPDGKRVVFAGFEDATAIQDVGVDDGSVRTLVGDDGHEYHFPQWVTEAPAPQRPETPPERAQQSASLRDQLQSACGRLLFEGPDGGLVSTAPDGTDAEPLGLDPSFEYSVSAGGDLLAYSLDIPKEYRATVILHDVTRKEQREMGDGEAPSLAPSGGMFAYWRGSMRNTIDFAWALVVVDLETGEQREVYRGQQLTPVQPAWSHDESRIAFFAEAWPNNDIDNAQIDLSVLDVASGAITAIARLGEHRPESPPAWSLDGSQLAFADNMLELVNVDGGPVRRFSAGAECVSWAPSGDQLVVRDFPGIALVEPVSGQVTWLSSDVAGVVTVPPAWSPDGRWLAYTSSGEQLVVMDVATRGVVALEVNGKEPRWVDAGCTSP